jgi:hypothetical protein
MGLSEFVTESVVYLLNNGSKLVTEVETKRRLSICNECENKGIVNPLPLVKCEGCTLCGCPLATITKIDKNVLLGKALCKAGKWD